MKFDIKSRKKKRATKNEKLEKYEENRNKYIKIGNRLLAECVTVYVFFCIFTFQMKEDEEKEENMKKRKRK